MIHAYAVYCFSSPAPWIKIVPWGLRAVLNWIRVQYNNPVVYITENGIADDGESLHDQQRMDYYKHHVNNVLKGERESVQVGGILENSVQRFDMLQCLVLILSIEVRSTQTTCQKQH